jgi:DNA-directed RNA polymerase subunit beta'
VFLPMPRLLVRSIPPGFKENVILGHLIPAGTGFHTTRNLRVEELVDPSEIIADKEADAEEAEEAEETA